MNKHLSRIGVAVLLAIATGACAAGQNLVVNGDFENTLLTHSGEIADYNLTGWSRLTAGAKYVNNAYNVLYLPGEATTLGATGTNDTNNFVLWQADDSPTGGNFVAIDGDLDFAGAIQQTVQGLTVGQTYALTFSFAGAESTGRQGPTSEAWQVGFGTDVQKTQVLTNVSEGFTGWYTTTMTFTANATSEILSFLASGTPEGFPPISLLDGVSLVEVPPVSPVPEPSSWAMMALGMGGIIGMLRKHRGRKQSADSKTT